ncbi:hypothetical protein BDN72DRAFT_864960 [Pluteus cervinus]|uniref:Uncharacterized protein n=1 Tax=Pluteus cervinus TaxID=181527 RepID=A0ACD3A275_9AGAR|nr:hypothetical protein BDN72DRAFT_864960 [Pluteus cervinus]
MLKNHPYHERCRTTVYFKLVYEESYLVGRAGVEEQINAEKGTLRRPSMKTNNYKGLPDKTNECCNEVLVVLSNDITYIQYGMVVSHTILRPRKYAKKHLTGNIRKIRRVALDRLNFKGLPLEFSLFSNPSLRPKDAGENSLHGHASVRLDTGIRTKENPPAQLPDPPWWVERKGEGVLLALGPERVDDKRSTPREGSPLVWFVPGYAQVVVRRHVDVLEQRKKVADGVNASDDDG